MNTLSPTEYLPPRPRLVRRSLVSSTMPSRDAASPTTSRRPGNSSRAGSVINRRHERVRHRSSQSTSRHRVLLREECSIEESSPPPSTVAGIKVPATIPNSTLLEHIATSRFFHHYVSPDRTFCRLDLDFTSLVIDNGAMRSSLAEVVIALGILTLPRKSEASVMAAQLRYARALRMTNRALQDEREAKSDGVLMAVILLSFFETTPSDEHSMASWTAHLDGARTLLRIRGREVLQRGPTYRMFSMLRAQIILNSLMTMQPVPQDLIDLSTQISETQEEDEKAGSQMLLLFARLGNLLASSRNISYLERHDILAQARALDDELVSWSRALPSSYEYFTEPANASANTFSGYCEIYSSLFAAEVWNFYRSARMGVNGIIVEQQSLLDQETAALFGQDETTSFEGMFESGAISELDVRLAVLESLRNDVCAGTPFMLGRHSNTGLAMVDIPLCKRTPAMHYLMYMLHTPGITPEMSEWTMAQIAELRVDQEVESGAVWNSKHMHVSSGS